MKVRKIFLCLSNHFPGQINTNTVLGVDSRQKFSLSASNFQHPQSGGSKILEYSIQIPVVIIGKAWGWKSGNSVPVLGKL
jgi:hypothetical protein